MASTRKLSTVKPKQPSPLAKSGAHPTRDKLLAVTVELLQNHLPQAVTAQMVLDKSGVSRGSLYHHFEDFPELLEVALVENFAMHVDRTILFSTGLLLTTKSKNEFIQGIFKITSSTQGRGLKSIRFQRARLIVFSEDNPRLAQALAVEQQRLTRAIADLFREAQERGWMSKSFDPLAGSVLIQAYTLGKIVDDIVADPMAEKSWDALINSVIETVFAAEDKQPAKA